MKNKVIIAILALTTLISCNNDPDNAIYDVFDGLTNGAVVRTLDITSPTFDVLDLNSFFEVVVEEQDEESGGLLASVDVFINSDGASESLVSTIPASEFSTTANGLPGATIRVVLQDALATLGLSPDAIECGDAMIIRLAVNLTDGRTFSAADGSNSLQGSYFRSPYIYNVNIVANLPTETTYAGQYELEIVNPGNIFGSTDYAEGTYTIEATGGASRVIRSVPTLPLFGLGPQDIALDFVCGEILLSGPLGAGCAGGALISGPADENSTYDLANPDDQSFIVKYTSDINNGCGAKSQASFRLTRVGS